MQIKVWMGITMASLMLVGAMIVGGAVFTDEIAAQDPPEPLSIKIVAALDPPEPMVTPIDPLVTPTDPQEPMDTPIVAANQDPAEPMGIVRVG